jgi:hypothetical protein
VTSGNNRDLRGSAFGSSVDGRIALIVAVALTLCGRTADARIVRIEITSRETPSFEGRTFGNVGPYEKLRGRAYGEVDPADPKNAVIADIELAPRTVNGTVAYAMDIFILKPIDLSRGNQKLFNDNGLKYGLAYLAATLDTSKALLTSRVRLDDAPVTVPHSGWL